jgi:hypothetical protein
MATKCKDVLTTCGGAAFANDLLVFADFCEWTADDRKTKYTGFRHSSNVYKVKALWIPLERQLRAYQQKHSNADAGFQSIEHVLKEMDRYMKHCVNDNYMWD